MAKSQIPIPYVSLDVRSTVNLVFQTTACYSTEMIYLFLMMSACGSLTETPTPNVKHENTPSAELEQVAITWETGPDITVSTNSLVIYGTYLDVSPVAIIRMKCCGTLVEDTVLTLIAPGTYRLNNITFSMPGSWELIITTHDQIFTFPFTV